MSDAAAESSWTMLIRCGLSRCPRSGAPTCCCCSVLDLNVRALGPICRQRNRRSNAMNHRRQDAHRHRELLHAALLRPARRSRPVLGHETAHVLSQQLTLYTTALVLLPASSSSALLSRSLLLGLPVRAHCTWRVLERSRAAELSARTGRRRWSWPTRSNPARVLMALAGGSVPRHELRGASSKQANDYDAEDDLFSRHTCFWSELNLTHPVAVRRVKELHGVGPDRCATNRIRDSDSPAPGGEEPPPSKEYEDGGGACTRERFGADPGPDRPAGCRRSSARPASAAGSKRFQNAAADDDGGDEEDDLE